MIGWHTCPCGRHPSFALPGDKPKYCKNCRPSEAYINVTSKKCQGCNSYTVSRYPYLCQYCKSPQKLTRIEHFIVDHIIKHVTHPFISRDKMVGGNACLKQRPDLLFAPNDFNEQKEPIPLRQLIVEIDENHGHQDRDWNCERTREQAIFETLGCIPLTFIRFNPESFKVGGRIRKVGMQQRLKTLVETINQVLHSPKLPEDDPLQRIYLYYGDYETSNHQVQKDEDEDDKEETE